MKQLVIMPGGFHPFHAGHAALYNSAVEAFPGADVYVAATNDTSTRPFPFPVKEKLAQLAGVAPRRFVQVKSPFRAEEIVHKYDPNNTQLIFVRSEKDAGSQPKPGGTKKDGSPSYLQPYDDASDQPLSQHAYMAYLPTVEFGPGMTSATEIRGAWPKLNDKRKTALVMSLYPRTQSNPKLAATVVKLLDTAMGTQSVDEANGPPDQLGAGMTAGYQRRENQPVDENQGWAATYENTAPNPQVNLTPNYPNYATLIGEFMGINKNRAVFRIIAAELKPGQGETAKITKALATGTPIGIEIGRVKNRAVLEALKPDAFNALQQAKQNIEQQRQQEIDQWAQDFRANSTKLAGQQLRRAVTPPPVPVAQPGEKHAALQARIAQLDLAIKKQQQLDALTQKLEYKGLLTPAMQMDFDTRMYVRDAAADNYQALNQKLDRAIELATNRLRTNKLAFRENADYIEEARKI